MEVEDSPPTDVQRETAYLTHHFAPTGLVPIILGAPENKLGIDVPVQFIGHVPQKIPGGNAGLTGTPLVHHTICIIVEDLLLKGVQGLVELEPSMTGGESRHKDVGFGAFDSIVLDAGVDGFQDVVGTEAERADVEGSIGDEAEQMSRVLDGDAGGFVDPLPEYAPETVQHELGGDLATSVFGNAADIESDTLPLLVTKNIVSFLLEGLTPTGPPRRFLFDLDPRVDVMGEETRLTLLGGENSRLNGF